MDIKIKKIIKKVQGAQTQLQKMIQSHHWIEEARQYAERQSREVKKLFSSDIEKVKQFLEKERKELVKFQKKIPSEVKKFKKFVQIQKKECDHLLASVRQMGVNFKQVTSSQKRAPSKSKSRSGVSKKKPGVAPKTTELKKA